MGHDVSKVRGFAFAVPVSDLPVASLVKNPPESLCVTAVVEIPNGYTLRIHRIHGKPCSTALALTAAVPFGLRDPYAATLARQDNFRIREFGADQGVQAVAEKLRKLGEAPANNSFNLSPRPLPPILRHAFGAADAASSSVTRLSPPTTSLKIRLAIAMKLESSFLDFPAT